MPVVLKPLNIFFFVNEALYAKFAISGILYIEIRFPGFFIIQSLNADFTLALKGPNTATSSGCSQWEV